MASAPSKRCQWIFSTRPISSFQFIQFIQFVPHSFSLTHRSRCLMSPIARRCSRTRSKYPRTRCPTCSTRQRRFCAPNRYSTRARVRDAGKSICRPDKHHLRLTERKNQTKNLFEYFRIFPSFKISCEKTRSRVSHHPHFRRP